MNIAVFIFLILCGSFAQAKSNEFYECIIENVSDTKKNIIIEKYFIGSSFRVEIGTGKLSGILKNDYINNPIVIDFGDEENSYKALNYLKKNRVRVLEVIFML